MNNQELYSQIAQKYNTEIKNDNVLNGLLSKVKNKTATQKDISRIADRLGLHAKEAFIAYLTPETLPEEKLYWNIARDTIEPIMENVHANINSNAILQLSAEDVKNGISVNIKKGSDKSIHKLMNDLVTASEAGALEGALSVDVETAARKMYDDFQIENCALRNDLGYGQYIVREYDDVGLHGKHDPCGYCLSRAGTYSYPYDALDVGVFARHPGCGCRITMITDGSKSSINNYSQKTNSDVAYIHQRDAARDDAYARMSKAKTGAERSEIWQEYEKKKQALISKYHVTNKKYI